MGTVYKVVIDTNIFVSGFGWDGKPEAILALLKDDYIKNYLTAEIFEELKRVISYKKLNFSESLQNKILEFVFFYSIFIESHESISAIKSDPDDNKFLECAVNADAEFVISGDPHLLTLKRYGPVEIVNADEFLERFHKRK